MKKQLTLIGAALLLSTIFTACNKDEVTNPEPVEQELITTVKLVVTGDNNFRDTFMYKVEQNGGTPAADDIRLEPNKTYLASVLLSDDSKTPAEDITSEVIDESDEHLFLFTSEPTTGAGSIGFSNGSKDDKGDQFNQTISFNTGAAGNGSLSVTLKHQPTNKNAATAAEAGGETDVYAPFTVILE